MTVRLGSNGVWASTRGWVSHAMLASLIGLVGCSLGNRSFTILNVATGERTFVARKSRYREVVVRTDDRTGTFHTLYRDSRNQFVLRIVGYDGKVLASEVMSCLPKSCLGFYHVEQGYALSPDGTCMAYFDVGSRELRLFDLRAQISRTVAAGLVESAAAVDSIEWISDSELLLAVEGGDKAATRFLVMDVRDGTIRAEVRTARGSLLLGVRTDGRFVSYKDDSVGKPDLLIYDLRAQRQVGHIVPAAGLFAYNGQWTDNGGFRLLYIEKGNSPVLKEYFPSSGQRRELKRWDSSWVIDICALSGSKVAYRKKGDWSHGPRMSLFVWDFEGGKETELKDVGAGPSILIVDHGQRIIYEHWP